MEREIFALATASLLLGASAVAITSVIRALAPERLLLRRPIGCDLCMSVWTVLFVAVGLFGATQEIAWFWLIAPAITVSLFLIPRLSPPPLAGPPE